MLDEQTGVLSRALVRVTSATNFAADTSGADEDLIRPAFTPAYPPMFVQTKHSASECHLHVIIPTHVAARCHHFASARIYILKIEEKINHNDADSTTSRLSTFFDSFRRGGLFSWKPRVFAKHRRLLHYEKSLIKLR